MYFCIHLMPPLAYAKIRKEIKRTMKKHINNYILAAFAAILVFVCIRSIYAPMHFDGEREAREWEVKLRLTAIRRAQEANRRLTGTYSGSFEELTTRGLLADSQKFIPYSGGMVFHLRTATLTMASGREVPVMECSTTFDEYLKGLDEASIAELTEEAGNAGMFPGLKIGDIEKNNDNAGNWE